jgi:hypothetical protein
VVSLLEACTLDRNHFAIYWSGDWLHLRVSIYILPFTCKHK